jgi:hypothetical protein
MKISSAFPLAVLLTVSLLISPSKGQQYDQGDQGYGDQDEFAQDNLYADYAARQQEKAVGGGGYVTLHYTRLDYLALRSICKLERHRREKTRI